MWKDGRVLDCILLFVNIICSSQTDAACDNSTTPLLNNITMRDPKFFSANWTDGEGLLLSDGELSADWYSAVLNGRQYIMVDSKDVPVLSSCNTLYPYYLKNEHPSVDEISETPMTREVYTVNLEQSYNASINVLIRKCDKEIQYFLQPTLNFSAYCFRAEEVIYDTEVPPPSDENLGHIRALPELRFKEIPVAIRGPFKIRYYPYIQFRCVFSNFSNYFYNVQWRIDGKLIASLGPSQDMDDLSLHEQYFQDLPLGYLVQCSVTISAVKFGQQTEPKYSDNFYVGVKIYNSTVYLKKGGLAQILIVPTLPIGCRHFDRFYLECSDELRIRDAAEPMCFKETVNNIVYNDGAVTKYAKCTQGIQTLYKGATWDPDKRYSYTIATSDNEDKNNFILKLKFSGYMTHAFWRNKVLPDVRVIVIDDKDYRNKVCQKMSGHLKTADGYYFPVQREGDFILYYNKQYKIEVQETTYLCKPSAYCICGVSIRAGKDVFMINRCGTINFLGFSQCDDGGILQVVRDSQRTYTVFTPIGTEITIKIFNNLLNIRLRMAPKDKNNVRGLCGNFDGDVKNDLVHSNGTISALKTETSYNSRLHEEFANSWRIPEERLYSKSRKSLESWAYLNGRYCLCQKVIEGSSEEVICSSTQYHDCSMQNSITKSKCYKYSRRKKRSQGSHEKEMDRLFRLMQPLENHNIRKTTNGQPFADVYADSINTIAKDMMNEVPPYVDINKNEVQLFHKKNCSSNCSDRGKCSDDGNCICHQYYHGAICDIDERIPPIVTDIEGGGVCDTADGDDCRCFYLRGDNFIKSIECKIVTSEISISGEEINVTVQTLAGGFEDIFTGVCCIPEENVFSRDMFIREHDVSVSSDGVHYGENNTMYIFDSTCQKLESLATGRPSFKLKNGFCFIGHACIKDTYAFLAENGSCFSCDTSVSVTDWTETSLATCSPTSSTTSRQKTKSSTVSTTTQKGFENQPYRAITPTTQSQKTTSNIEKEKNEGFLEEQEKRKIQTSRSIN